MENDLLKQMTNKKQSFKYFHILCSIYVAAMITSLTVSARLLSFHIPFTSFNILLSAGTWIIPISFFIQDITTEVYGYERSRQLVQMSAAILTGYILYLMITTFFTIPTVENISESYNTIFDALPRHLIALLVAIISGNLINDYILSMSKKKLKGKYLPLRFIFSTMIGEAVLQLSGTLIAWFGTLHLTTQIVPFILFSYCYKVAFEVFMTPATIFICKQLKKYEEIDAYDYGVNYNPFKFNINRKK